jgi:hypothetical protein
MCYYFTLAEMEKPLWVVMGIVARLCVSVSVYSSPISQTIMVEYNLHSLVSVCSSNVLLELTYLPAAEDRDSGQFKLSPEETTKRRMIMWEVYSVDLWQVRRCKVFTPLLTHTLPSRVLITDDLLLSHYSILTPICHTKLPLDHRASSK